MRNYYLAISIISFLVLLVLAMGVYTLNFSHPEQGQMLDEQRRSGILALQQQIEEFWFRSGRLPDSLFEMRLVGDYRDPATGKTYDYIKSDPQHYSICAVFSLPSPPNAAFFHPQGYGCLRAGHESVGRVSYPTMAPIVFPTPTGVLFQSLHNGSFEDWSHPLPDGWNQPVGSQLSKIPTQYNGRYAIGFVAHRANNSLYSDPVLINENQPLLLTVFYHTQSKCTDCAYVGWQFFDPNGIEITQGAPACGWYSTETHAWSTYIREPTSGSGYKQYLMTCTTPPGANSYRVKLGVWDAPDEEWQMDTVAVTRQPITSRKNE